MSQKNPIDWPSPLDPLTAAYQGIATALLNNATFAALVKLANLNVWADGKQKSLLSDVQDGNLPEMTIVQGAHTIHPWGRNSERADYLQTYSLVAITDTMQVSTINQIKRAFAGAIYHANPESWTWNGSTYIDDILIGGGGDGSSGIALPTVEATRGIDRQGTIISVQISMYESRSSLPT